MKKELPLDTISIDKKSKTPIYQQLYNTIKKGIISNNYPANNRLPSSRQLSKELDISRSTVTTAYDQLIAEGFLISKKGSGTSIAEALTHTLKPASKPSKANKINSVIDLSSQLSNMAKTYNNLETQQRIRTNYKQTTLMPGIPSRHNFPNAKWGKLLGKYARQSLGTDAGYDYPCGIPQLKKAIANYIRLARGINTEEKDILIVNSTQTALDILCRLILNKGDIAGIEEPGYRGAYLAMKNSEAVIQSIAVDNEGMVIPSTILNAISTTNTPTIEKAPKLIYTSPSHQYPTGVTMSYSRRIALLEYAHQYKSWILEDDYDSEFRYRGKPLPSLQGLDQNQRVIYLGTFSKSLSPSMRVAYIVAPPALSPIIKTFLGDIGTGINIAVQYALAEFIEAGHYSRHIRKTRKEYAEKQQILSTAIAEYLHDKVDFFQSNAGLQATLYFKEDSSKKTIVDRVFVKEAEKEGLYLRPLSSNYRTALEKQGLILGFAACDKETINSAIQKLAQLIENSFSNI